MHFQTVHVDTRKWREKKVFILISSKDIAIWKHGLVRQQFITFSQI